MKNEILEIKFAEGKNLCLLNLNLQFMQSKKKTFLWIKFKGR